MCVRTWLLGATVHMYLVHLRFKNEVWRNRAFEISGLHIKQNVSCAYTTTVRDDRNVCGFMSGHRYVLDSDDEEIAYEHDIGV